jgi:hypothetical protein
MDQPPGSQEQPAAAKKDRFARFRGLRWWELVLALLPIALVAIGGLLGGLIGALGLVINLALARRRLGAGLKLVAMLGVVIAAYVVYFVVAGIISNLIH